MRKTIFLALCLVAVVATPVSASTRLKNICRIKGQEDNTLRGIGIVVGLNGTGESNDPATMRAIARAMEILGNPVATDPTKSSLDELKKYKNIAMVMVTAKVPGTGGRRGDHVDCSVSAMNGKSLDGGRLAFASLMGPNTQDHRVYALCEGQITIDNANQATVGTVHAGCQLEADLFTPFYRDGCITFVLDKNHADFQTANEIVYKIRQKLMYSESADVKSTDDMVYAKDAANIIVRIPAVYTHDPVAFASDLLDTRLDDPQTESRVVINSKAGTIVISGDVEIGDVIVSHKNVVVDASQQPAIGFIDVDKSNEPKLQELVNQLNALKVPTADMIEIIKGIDRNGKLHGRLIIDDQG